MLLLKTNIHNSKSHLDHCGILLRFVLGPPKGLRLHIQRQGAYLHPQQSFVVSQFRFTEFSSSDSCLHHCSVNILLLRLRCVAYVGEREEDTPTQNVFCDWGKVNN